jgi:hypothetical protein
MKARNCLIIVRYCTHIMYDMDSEYTYHNAAKLDTRN